MAFAMQTKTPAFPAIYNVEQSVGLNSVNANGDVRLVQYMLRSIYGSSAAALTVDGWAGPITATWIKKFQNDAKASGSNILVDGRVDRALGQMASISRTVYSILLMNFTLKKKNPAAYRDLPRVVPLNPHPRSNPYNPKPAAKPREVLIYNLLFWLRPKQIIVVYDDGTSETHIVEGRIIIDGEEYV